MAVQHAVAARVEARVAAVSVAAWEFADVAKTL